MITMQILIIIITVLLLEIVIYPNISSSEYARVTEVQARFVTVLQTGFSFRHNLCIQYIQHTASCVTKVTSTCTIEGALYAKLGNIPELCKLPTTEDSMLAFIFQMTAQSISALCAVIFSGYFLMKTFP
jgi:hypothetical protein